MLVRIIRSDVDKVVSCEGWIRTRFAAPLELENEEEWIPLKLSEPVQDGYEGVTILELRPDNGLFGSFYIPERPENKVFFMDDKWETRERLRWD